MERFAATIVQSSIVTSTPKGWQRGHPTFKCPCTQWPQHCSARESYPEIAPRNTSDNEFTMNDPRAYLFMVPSLPDEGKRFASLWLHFHRVKPNIRDGLKIIKQRREERRNSRVICIFVRDQHATTKFTPHTRLQYCTKRRLLPFEFSIKTVGTLLLELCVRIMPLHRISLPCLMDGWFIHSSKEYDFQALWRWIYYIIVMVPAANYRLASTATYVLSLLTQLL